MSYINHPRLRPELIEFRHYQFNIARVCMSSSTLVVLPTGMGKTIIALLLIAHRLGTGRGKILFMAPTKPLVQQHVSSLEAFLDKRDEHRVTLFTGEVPPAKRKAMWDDSRIIVSTPQVIQNDIIGGRIDLRDVSLVIFDEAHRAVGDYAYTFIGERYQALCPDPLVLGMTASPGSDHNKILEVCDNLGVDAVEIRSEFDPDVMPYIHRIELEWIRVKMPRLLEEGARILRGMLDDRLKQLSDRGLLRRGRVSTKDLLDLQKMLSFKVHAGEAARDPFLYTALSLQAAAMKINHALELAETQGKEALMAYMERLEKEVGSRGSSKAAHAVVFDPGYRRLRELLEQTSDENPKRDRITEIVLDQFRRTPGSRIIVFTHYRDTATQMSQRLRELKHPGVKAVRFVGQASHGEDRGLRQKEQIDVISKFRDGTYNVLVGTSVAEEGLDIPATDLVIFYEPVPSEIRLIQRRGRTGRSSAGRVVVMIFQGTKDEAYLFSSRNKEKKMKKELELLKRQLGPRAREHRPAGDAGDFTLTGENGEVPGGPPRPHPDGEVPTTPGAQLNIPLRDIPHAPRPEGSPPSLEELAWTDIPGKKASQTALSSFHEGAGSNDDRERITVDNREFRSRVAQELSRRNVVVEPVQLEVGDYVLSERLVVERKTSEDLVQSLMDGRLFTQASALARSRYPRRLILVEGEDIYSVRRMNQEAIRGALLSLMLDLRIPVHFTKGPVETADLLVYLLKKERRQGQAHGIRDGKSPMNLHERQRFVAEGLPNISATLAKRLLERFGTLQAIFDATPEQLCEVQGIGPATAREIRDLLLSDYRGNR